MAHFMTHEELIEVTMKLKKKTEKQETDLKSIYDVLLATQSQMIQANKRIQDISDKNNKVLTGVNLNQDEPGEDFWQEQINECTAELLSNKKQISQQREILMQLELKYFTEFKELKEKVDEENTNLEVLKKETECKFDELQRETFNQCNLLQQEQDIKFNEIYDLKSKMKSHNDILEQHITDNGYKFDDMQNEISKEFVAWKEKHENLKLQVLSVNEILQNNSEKQIKFDEVQSQLLNKISELEDQLKQIKSQTNNKTGILKQQQIQLHNDFHYIKTHIFKLANGMDVMEGMTPLHMVCEYGLQDVDSERFYETTSINAVNNEGMTPLHLACKYGLMDIAIKLITHGANVNACNKEKMTPIHFACKNDFYEVYQPLTLGCFKIKYKKDKSLLRIAIKDHKDLSILLELLNHGANINCKNAEKWTALHFAAHSGYDIMVRELLKQGADIHCKTNKGSHALHLAALQGYLPTEIEVDTLPDNNYENIYKDNILYNDDGRHLSVITELFSHGADASCKNKFAFIPLHVAAFAGNLSVVKELLKQTTNIDCKNKNKETPLHIASRYGYVAIVTELLKYGAFIHSRNINNDTPLHLAAKNGLVSTIIELLNHNACIRYKNRQSKSALDLAKEMMKTEAIKILIEHESPKEEAVLL